jgi:hypothetical protein
MLHLDSKKLDHQRFLMSSYFDSLPTAVLCISQVIYESIHKENLLHFNTQMDRSRDHIFAENVLHDFRIIHDSIHNHNSHLLLNHNSGHM